MGFYKNLLKFIQMAIIFVVLPRIAEFVGILGNNPEGPDFHDLIRYAFAATLGLGTVGASYFSNEAWPPDYEDEPPNPKERRRREREAAFYAMLRSVAPTARMTALVFASLDGVFNLADALLGASRAGLFAVENGPVLVWVYGTATTIYGLVPTILALVLSRLIARIDRIPERYERALSAPKVDWAATLARAFGLALVRGEERLSGGAPNGRTAEQKPARARLPERPNGQNAGQAKRILAYLDEQAAGGYLPGVSEIVRALPAPRPSKSTVSVWRNAWLKQNGRGEERLNGNSERGG